MGKKTEIKGAASLFDGLEDEDADKVVDTEAGVDVATDAADAPDVADEADVNDAADAAQDADVEEAEDSAADEGEDVDEGAVGTIGSIMEGSVESDGALTLARYASRAYLEYAMSVVKSRALPEVSDGQKPVQRRILFDMARAGLKAPAKPIKCARVVGSVLGFYHPHGDQSVYDALVRMAQKFSLRYPLIHGEGNFGSRDGDRQAAMRYTETRLTPFAELLLDEIDQGAIDYTPNYDGTNKEPVVLPAKLPMVLLNGASGIAVGMATEIPSHNLNEVAAACELLINKPEATLDEVMEVLKGPDFPCGAQITSPVPAIREIYRTGRGKLRVRARYHFEELQRGQWQLVVDELPPDSSAALVLNQIEQITNPKTRGAKKTLSAKQQQAKSAMLSILDRVRDESDKDTAMRLVFEPKTSRIDRREFLDTLLAQTALESNVSVNMVMLGLDGKPAQKNLLSILNEWIRFRTECVRRRTKTRLDAVLDRLHVLEGRMIALLNLDRVIAIIRNEDEPKARLIEEFKLTDRQAEDILEIRLRQLARMASLALEREANELDKEREGLEKVLGNEHVLKRLVVKEIRECAKKFGDERRTLIQEAEEAVLEQKVPDEPVTVILSKKGFIRTRSGHDYDSANAGFKMGDELDRDFECRTVDDMTFVAGDGRTYTVKVADLPGGRGDGLPLSSFIDVAASEDFPAVLIGSDEDEVALATTDGYGYTAKLKDLKSSTRVGKQHVRLNEGARVLGAVVRRPGQNRFAVLSKDKRFLIFQADELRELKNGGLGVVLIKLDDGDALVGFTYAGEEGVRIHGHNRNKAAKDVLVRPARYADFEGRRANKGRVLKVTWNVEALAAVVTEADAEGAGDLDDESPTLL